MCCLESALDNGRAVGDRLKETVYVNVATDEAGEGRWTIVIIQRSWTSIIGGL
jgi:hypothetical protein